MEERQYGSQPPSHVLFTKIILYFRSTEVDYRRVQRSTNMVSVPAKLRAKSSTRTSAFTSIHQSHPHKQQLRWFPLILSSTWPPWPSSSSPLSSLHLHWTSKPVTPVLSLRAGAAAAATAVVAAAAAAAATAAEAIAVVADTMKAAATEVQARRRPKARPRREIPRREIMMCLIWISYCESSTYPTIP